MQQSNRPISTQLLIATTLFALAGCGGDGFAPDSVVESPDADSFLNQVGDTCGKYSVGDQPLNWLLSAASNDTYFVDVTSKLYLGSFTQQQYADAINSFYPTRANQPALDCIFGLMKSGG